MRRYRIASWVLLILSVFDFTLAAPVAAQDIHGVRVNVVDAANDRIAALQKRMEQVYQNGGVNHAGQVYQNGGENHEPSDGSSAGDVNQVNQNGGENHEPPHGSSAGEVYQNGGVNHEPSDGSSAGQVHQNEGGPVWDDWWFTPPPSPPPHPVPFWRPSPALESSEIGPVTASDQAGDHEQSPPPDHEQSPPPGQGHGEDLPPSPESQHPAAPESEGFWSKLWKGAWQAITRLPCLGCKRGL